MSEAGRWVSMQLVPSCDCGAPGEDKVEKRQAVRDGVPCTLTIVSIVCSKCGVPWSDYVTT